MLSDYTRSGDLQPLRESAPPPPTVLPGGDHGARLTATGSGSATHALDVAESGTSPRKALRKAAEKGEPTLERTCLFCGKLFYGIHRRKYCSVICRSRADYRRYAEQRRADRRARYRLQKGSR